MSVSKSHIKVRYAETDRMGIVHHSNYPIYFEVGRTDYIQKLGMSYGDIEELGVLLPLVELECHFIAGARYEDELVVETRLTGLSAARCVYFYEIYHVETGKKLCEGTTSHAFVGVDFKPLNLKKRFPDIYQMLEDNL